MKPNEVPEKIIEYARYMATVGSDHGLAYGPKEVETARRLAIESIQRYKEMKKNLEGRAAQQLEIQEWLKTIEDEPQQP